MNHPNARPDLAGAVVREVRYKTSMIKEPVPPEGYHLVRVGKSCDGDLWDAWNGNVRVWKPCPPGVSCACMALIARPNTR